MAYIGTSPTQAVRTRFLYTATASQTTFSGADTQNLTLRYSDANFVDVYQNGVLLKGGGADYTATTTTSVVLATGATADDVIEIIVYDVFAVANLIKKDGDTVEGVINFNGKEITLDADFDTSITADTDDQIDFKTGGTDRMTIDSSGHVNLSNTLKLKASLDNPILFENQHSVTTDGSISTFDDSSGTMVVVGSNFYINSSGSETRFNTSEESSAIMLNRNGEINLLTGGTGATASTRVNIDSSGKVGIGTTSPSQLLDLESAAPVIRFTDSDASGTPECEVSGAGGDITIRADRDNEKSSSIIGFEVDGSEKMRIDSNGRVGINTTSPDAQLVIARQSGSSDIAKINLDSDSIDFFTQGKTFNIGTTDTTVIRFFENNTEAMRINNDAQVLIGTTSSLYSSTQKDGLQIEGAGGGPFVIVCKNVDTGGGANQILFLDGSGDTCGEIASNATNNTTSYGTSSDYRLKENITDVTNAISTLKKLKPKTYNFISDPDNISEDGFLAHELGAVVPNAVTGEKDDMTSDNKIKPQQVDYGRLTPLLTAALQEAIARIDTLEAEVKTLKGE